MTSDDNSNTITAKSKSRRRRTVAVLTGSTGVSDDTDSRSTCVSAGVGVDDATTSSSRRKVTRRKSSNSLGSLASVRKRASNKSSNIEDALGQVQRQQLLDTIDRLSCHLPKTVLDQLVRQVVNEENEDQVLGLLGKSILVKPPSQLEDLRLLNSFKPRRSKSMTQLTLQDIPNPKIDLSKILLGTNPIGMALPMDDSLSATVSDTSSMADDASWFVTTLSAGDDNDIVDHDDHDSILTDGSAGTTLGASNVHLHLGEDSNPEEEEEQGVERLCQGRLSISSHNSLPGLEDSLDISLSCRELTAATNHTNNAVIKEAASVARTHANRTRLESTRHQSAILFVDISGFTKLSTSLELESLSKVINSYFQKIVDIIRSYDGDVLKFAGDALLVEWKLLPDTKHTSYKHPAFRAAVCAAKLVEECCDFPVDIPSSESNDKNSLNIHCAIAFGQVVGTHVGDRNRMEYVILGDALKQITAAMKHARLGQVVASPETLDALDWIVHFDSYFKEHSRMDKTKPEVIAIKSRLFFKPIDPKAMEAITILQTNDDDKLSSRCHGWTTSMLVRLKKRMTPYAHPVVLQSLRSVPSSSQSTASNNQRTVQRRMSITPLSLNRTPSAMTAEQAELRDVVTVFLQPILPDNVNILSNDHVSDHTLGLLQQIMVIVQAETQHHQGQLRQFIVDDKGLVLIVNWGLRGSTYPNMVVERVMPCIRKIQTLLHSELGIQSKLGATSGKLYCGVVGAQTRHEYAMLGPSCNLASRLMGCKDNPGVLLDQALLRKAGKTGHHPFRARKPITAKGYDYPVRIYEPARKLKTFKKDWLDIGQDLFVGRQDELGQIVSLASGILATSTHETENEGKCLRSHTSKFVFIEALYGMGKSCLLSKATRQLEFVARSCRHITRHVFSEDDSFKPFSIVRPLFLDLLRRQSSSSSDKSVVSEQAPKVSQAEKLKKEDAQLYLIFLQTSLQAGIPMPYIEMFAGMIFTETLSDGDIGKWSDKKQKMSEWIRVAQQLVKVYLEMTKSFDLMVLALDDINCMDEMSWRVVKRLYERTSKFLILGSARSEHGLNLQAGVWEEMKGNGLPDAESKFIHMKLDAMDEAEITTLTRSRLCKDSVVHNDAIYRTIYFLAEGNPLLACEITDIFILSSKPESTQRSSEFSETVSELLLNRLDSLPSSVRLHVQCGAILGHSFTLADIVSVMEVYNGLVTPEEKSAHELEVRHSLDEAERTGFLSASKVRDTSLVVYTFSHVLLRDVISQHILQQFKDKITRLIDSISNSSDLITFQELRHHLAIYRSKAVPVLSE